MKSTASLVLSGVLLFGTPDFSFAAAAQAERDASSEAWAVPHRQAALDVPFVAQGPLLCGGAAVAMVERFWGARGVYAEDFQELVREDEGGIRTSELMAAVRERGYEARPVRHDPEAVLAALDEGIPPILLLESGFTRLHYVVLIGRSGDRLLIHDPNFGPARRVEQDALMRRWEASGFWALMAVPSDRILEHSPAPSHTVERSAPEPLKAAMERLRNGDWSGARDLARPLDGTEWTDTTEATDGTDGADTTEAAAARTARRIIATAWFLEGYRRQALQAWNLLDEPSIDLIGIEGLIYTRYHVAAARASLRHGDVLTARDLMLAERRMGHLPAIDDARVDYRPLPDGTVEVRASVRERRRWPTSIALGVQAIRSVAYRDALLEAGPFLAAGDRWRVRGSWRDAQRFVGGALAAPAPPLPGIVTVGLEWRRERFVAGTSAGGAGVFPYETEARLQASLGIEEWVHAGVRVGGDLSMESWTSGLPRAGISEATRLVSGALAVRWMGNGDRTWADVRGERWVGSSMAFGRVALELGTSIPWGDRQEWRLRAGGVAVGHGAPRMLWPGAGMGRIRAPLLRAHDLDEDGVIRGPAFGRELLHGTLEHRVFQRLGPFRAGASVFLDAAYAAGRGDGRRDRGFVDVGAGLFVEAWRREVTVALARGSSGWKASARVGDWP